MPWVALMSGELIHYEDDRCYGLVQEAHRKRRAGQF